MIINRTSITQILALFDYAYKRGVVDAYEEGDDARCEKFVEEMSQSSEYGLLADDFRMSTREWKFIVGSWCHERRLIRLQTKYIERIYAKNHLAAILPVVQDFYVRGVKDWLEYPNPTRVEVFKNSSRAKWLISGRDRKIMTPYDYASKVQEFCFNRERRAIKGLEELPKEAFMNFSSEIWLSTRKY